MPRPGRPRIKLDIPERLRARYTAGDIDHHDVARLCGVSARVALRELRLAGLDTSRSTRKRLRRARALGLTELYESIRSLYGVGLSLREVARQFGLTAEGVRQILLRESVPLRPRGRCATATVDGWGAGRDFARSLRSARVAAGLTQKELAGRTRLSRQTISSLECGLRQPSRETLARLAEVLPVAGGPSVDPRFAPRPEAEAS